MVRLIAGNTQKASLGILTWAAVMMAVLQSGCIDPCGGSWGTSFWWNQDGIFERFPPEGTYGSFVVEWHTPEDDDRIVNPSKHADKKDEDWAISLTAREDSSKEFGNVQWYLDSERSGRHTLPDSQVYALLNETFQALGIGEEPIPSRDAHSVNWGTDPC